MNPLLLKDVIIGMKKVIKNILKKCVNQNSSDLLFEMADIKGERIGLPVTIWVSHKIASHRPRIKVNNDYSPKPTDNNMFSLSISDKPKILDGSVGELRKEDFDSVLRFVKINKDVLLDFWNNFEDDVFDLLPKLRKVT